MKKKRLPTQAVDVFKLVACRPFKLAEALPQMPVNAVSINDFVGGFDQDFTVTTYERVRPHDGEGKNRS